MEINNFNFAIENHIYYSRRAQNEDNYIYITDSEKKKKNQLDSNVPWKSSFLKLTHFIDEYYVDIIVTYID